MISFIDHQSFSELNDRDKCKLLEYALREFYDEFLLARETTVQQALEALQQAQKANNRLDKVEAKYQTLKRRVMKDDDDITSFKADPEDSGRAKPKRSSTVAKNSAGQ
jgi:hypothetical protein